MSRQILAVMSEREPHIKLVRPHLQDSELLVVDLAAVPAGTELSFVQDGPRQEVYFGDVELTHAQSIWWRLHPRGLMDRTPMSRIDSTLHTYVTSATTHHAMALGSWNFDAHWVSRPEAMAHADSKAGHLQLAHTVGFATPATLQTSNTEAARAFIRHHKEQGCIVKTLAAQIPRTAEGGWRVFWSTRASEKTPLDGLERAPAIFQQYVPGADLRVVVVGTKVFAAKITSNLPYPADVSDWRVAGASDNNSLLVEPFQLSRSDANKCVRLCQKLKIPYGALDFIVDSLGMLWYLEVNSMGAWAFIEMATGQEIGKAVAELLLA